MKFWERFKSYKQRGEWVELQFMAQASQRGLAVCKPWGETRPYDVGIEHGPNFLRVQVKSTSYRLSAGYLCQLIPRHQTGPGYTVKQVDLFAAYVIPVNAWYLIPAVLLLEPYAITNIMLSPVVPPVKKKCYRHEGYREAWDLLKKSRRQLAREPRADGNFLPGLGGSIGSRDPSTALWMTDLKKRI
jgi:PD-(D/E)XK nuclease superfamily protein